MRYGERCHRPTYPFPFPFPFPLPLTLDHTELTYLYLRERWRATQTHSSTLNDLRRAVKDNGSSSPCVSGLRSVCWKVSSLFNSLSNPSATFNFHSVSAMPSANVPATRSFSTSSSPEIGTRIGYKCSVMGDASTHASRRVTSSSSSILKL